MRDITHVTSEPIVGNEHKMWRNVWRLTADSGIEYRVVSWREFPTGKLNTVCGCGKNQPCSHGAAVIRHQTMWEDKALARA